MFDKVSEFFKGEASLEIDKNGNPSAKDLQIATGIILLEIAGADSDFDPKEVQAVFRAMEAEFKLKDTEVLNLLQEAQSQKESKGKIDDFIKAINDNFSPEQKQIILTMIWKVVLADAKLEKDEKRLATQMRVRLELTEEQAAQAIQKAQS